MACTSDGKGLNVPARQDGTSGTAVVPAQSPGTASAVPPRGQFRSYSSSPHHSQTRGRKPPACPKLHPPLQISAGGF